MPVVTTPPGVPGEASAGAIVRVFGQTAICPTVFASR